MRAAGLYMSPTRGGPGAARALGPCGAASVCCYREPPRLGCTGTPANRGRTEPRGRLKGDAVSRGRAGAGADTTPFLLRRAPTQPPAQPQRPPAPRACARARPPPRGHTTRACALLRIPRLLSHNASRTGRISRERSLSRPRGTRHLGEAGIT